MLVLDKVDKLCWVGLAQEVERTHLQTRRETVDDLERLVRTEGLFQDVLCILQTTRGDVVLCHAHGIKLRDDLRLESGRDLLLVGDLKRQLLDLVVIHVLKQLCGVLRTNGDKEDRRLLLVGQITAAI